MGKPDRLFDLMQAMRDGAVHRAADLAARHGVSERTIYRDMDRLAAAGVPVAGTRGEGYRMTAAVSLPPLNLTEPEFEALSLGVAIVAEAADPDLRAAGAALADKLDAVLPDRAAPLAAAWQPAARPVADMTRAFALMPTLRAAIRARQKVRITLDRSPPLVICPLRLDFWGRIWTLSAWCETTRAHRDFRIDLIGSATALPQMFADIPA